MPAAPERIAVTVARTAPLAPAAAFAAIAPIDLPSIFPGMRPVIPAVTGTRGQTGPWDGTGRERTVLLADGSEVPERLTAWDEGSSFGYTVGPFPPPLGRLIHDAEGEWLFVPPAGGGCEIVWTYAFAPQPRMGLLVRAVLAPVWRRYARRVLDLAVAAAVRTAEADRH